MLLIIKQVETNFTKTSNIVLTSCPIMPQPRMAMRKGLSSKDGRFIVSIVAWMSMMVDLFYDSNLDGTVRSWLTRRANRDVDMFIFPFEVLFDEADRGGRSTNDRVWSTGL